MGPPKLSRLSVWTAAPVSLCARAARLFDNAIMTATAAMFEQAQVPEGMAYCDADPDTHVYPIFNLQRGRISLPTYTAGMGLRAWSEHRHAAFVGMVAQSCKSSQVPFGRETRCAYPALMRLIDTAATKMEAGLDGYFWDDYVGSSPISLAVGDLVKAWSASVEATQEAFPAPRARKAGQGAFWLHATRDGAAEGQLRRINQMPTQSQRQLSKAVNKLAAQRVEQEFEEAEGRGDAAAGRLRQLFTFCNAFGVGEYRRAIPFMEDGELHMAYHEEMLNFVLEFGCLPPPDIRVPADFGGTEWTSKWAEYVGDSAAAVPTPDIRDAWVYYVMELHDRFEAYERSTDASVARTMAHDLLKELFAALARNAGAVAVAMEPRGWDALGAKDRHHRPDIEWLNPTTCHYTITDIVITWSMTSGDGAEHAAKQEQHKRTEYKPAMARNRAQAARAKRPVDEFRPLGFAKNGAWGPSTQHVFAALEKMVTQRRASAELWGWSAMSWRRHWPMRVGVTQARSRAAVVTEGVRSWQQTRGDGDGPEAEVSMQYDPHRA